MEAVVAGSMYKGISVEKRVETLYNLSVQKGQLTSGQQKELGDIYDLTSSNFIVHASTMGSMSMEKAEFQKGLERTAEGQTYLGYTLINATVGKMTQNNLDAGVGVSTWDDPANTRVNIESKGGVVAGDVAIGKTTDIKTVSPVVPISTGSIESVDWSSVSKNGKTSLDHIQKHTTVNFQREMHGVFNGNPQSSVEQAWSDRGSGVTISDGMGGTIHNIPYKNAGYNSGYVNFGQKMDFITVVTKDTTSIVWTAFPSFGNYGMKITH